MFSNSYVQIFTLLLSFHFICSLPFTLCLCPAHDNTDQSVIFFAFHPFSCLFLFVLLRLLCLVLRLQVCFSLSLFTTFLSRAVAAPVVTVFNSFFLSYSPPLPSSTRLTLRIRAGQSHRLNFVIASFFSRFLSLPPPTPGAICSVIVLLLTKKRW